MEIASGDSIRIRSFSALQRAEIAEIEHFDCQTRRVNRFSALQRAEIAEIWGVVYDASDPDSGFSALQRAEIAEMKRQNVVYPSRSQFQCSSTSRNC